MTSIIARLVAALAALATALFLSSCTSPTEPAGHNADDVAFATHMIPHHRQAVELSAMVPDRSTNPELIKLASNIAAAQGPEIETMKAFLAQWQQNP
ncbi:MAG: DUF305 domain-containing protein, partial [Mycobacterium sp.]